MARDFTDYVVEVMGSGDRVYFQKHFRQLKKDPVVTEFELHGRKYSINKDRAYLVKGYTPWKKWNIKEPLKSLNEILRSKKVGLIKYKEPVLESPTYRTVTIDTPDHYTCGACDWKGTKHLNAIRSHIARYHKGSDPVKLTVVHTKSETKKVVDRTLKAALVEPMHISRTHQPSGIIREGDKPIELDDESLLNIITPRLLKVEIEDDLYRKAYKSYKFGNLLPLTQKWWVWVVVAMIAIFGILFLTGNFKL